MSNSTRATLESLQFERAPRSNWTARADKSLGRGKNCSARLELPPRRSLRATAAAASHSSRLHHVVLSLRLGSARALPVVADKSIGHTNGRLGVRGGGRNQLRAAAARAGGKKGEREREKGEGRSRIKQARRRELLDRKTMNCRSAGCCSRRPFVRLVARSFELALQPRPQLQPQLQLQLELGRLPFGARCALPAGSQSSAA